MSCTGFDVRDYFLGELPEPERLQAARHIQGCAGCTGELEQLQYLRTALGTLRDEEPPQRIGFVSDKVFEPSPVRRWLGGFWLSGARVGFASAAMLSAALVFSATHRPETKLAGTKVVTPAAEQDVQSIVNEAVHRAVAETEARQEKKTRDLLAVAEEKHQNAERALNARLAYSFEVLEKRQGSLRASNMIVSGDQR
jgi:anti-sigma factor RsiW